MTRHHGLALLLGIAFAASPVLAKAGSRNTACLECHRGDPSIERFEASAHGKLACTACHTDVTETPHRSVMRIPLARHGGSDGRGIQLDGTGHILPVPDEGLRGAGLAISHVTSATLACSVCHADQATPYVDDVHGAAFAELHAAAPTCATCHGDHDIRPVEDLESRTKPGRVPEACASACHVGTWFVDRGPEDERGRYLSDPVGTYRESIHGKKLRLGHPDAPSCASCHGAHGVLPASHTASPLSREHVAGTCASEGACHVGADAAFAQSFHHRLEGRNPRTAMGRFEILLALNGMLVLTFAFADVALDLLRRVRSRR